MVVDEVVVDLFVTSVSADVVTLLDVIFDGKFVLAVRLPCSE